MEFVNVNADTTSSMSEAKRRTNPRPTGSVLGSAVSIPNGSSAPLSGERRSLNNPLLISDQASIGILPRSVSSGSSASFASSFPSSLASSSPTESPHNSPSPNQPSVLNTSNQEFEIVSSYSSDGFQEAPFSKTANFVSGARLRVPAEFSRSDHSTVLFGDDMYIYGGVSGYTLPTSIHVFNFATRMFGTVLSAGPVLPPPRYQHTAVVANGLMIVFGGGSENTLLNDLFIFNFEDKTWTEIVPATEVIPCPRRGHTSACVGRSLYIFGGIGEAGALNDMYRFDFDTKAWSPVLCNGMPCPRFLHTSCVYGRSIWVFGGTDGASVFGDLLEFNCETNSWEEVQGEPPSPSPRCSHAAAVFQDSMFILGGDTDGTVIDVFEFVFGARKWYRIQTTVPGVSRQGHSAVVRGESAFLFGGVEDPQATNLDVLSLGPKDDFEDDLFQESVMQEDDATRSIFVPRPMWEAVLLKKHPEILQYRELTRALTGVPSYARSRQVGFTEDPAHLNHQIVLNLVMEYLHTVGCSRTANAIVEESKVPYFPISVQPESRLVMILRVLKSRLRSKNLFEPEFTLANARAVGEIIDAEVELVDHLAGAGRIDTAADGEENVDIWDEKEDSRMNIVRGKDENGKSVIKAANLNKLVQVLTLDREKAPDAVYLKTFFYTYQSFTSPEMLLKKLIEKYHVPLQKGGTADERYKTEVVEPVQTRVCRVLKFWIEQCPWDFNGPTSEKLLNNLNAFIDGPLSRDGNFTLVKQLRNSITKSLKKRTGPEDDKAATITAGLNPPEPKVPRNIFSPHLTLKDIDELEIARQLTLIDYNLLVSVTPVEFLSKGWEDPSPKKSPHLKELLTRATDLTRWVAYSILKYDNKKTRAKMLEKFIKVADQLRTLKNFHSMYAVISGFNHPSITRLGQTFGEISPRAKEIYQELVLNAKDDKQYREIMKAVQLPCIPSIEYTLADISTAQEMPDNLNNLIHFQKRQHIFQHITKFQGFQQRQFNLLPVHQIASLLNKLTKITEKDLDETSKKLE